MTVTTRTRTQRPVGTSIAEARGLDAHALAVLDLAARASEAPRRDERLLALRDAYGPALREARIAVVHSVGHAVDLGRPRSAHTPGRSLLSPVAAALGAVPLVGALAALSWGAGLVAAVALGIGLWAALRPAVARLERGPLYSHGAPRVSRSAAKYLLGDLIDAHAAELLEHAGAPADHVAPLRARWDTGMGAVHAWRCAIATRDAGGDA